MAVTIMPCFVMMIGFAGRGNLFPEFRNIFQKAGLIFNCADPASSPRTEYSNLSMLETGLSEQ